jgi:hypothetical protein
LQRRTIAAIFEQLASGASERTTSQDQAIKPVPRHKYRLAPQAVRQAN